MAPFLVPEAGALVIIVTEPGRRIGDLFGIDTETDGCKDGSVEHVDALIVFDFFIDNDFVVLGSLHIADTVQERLCVAVVQAANLCFVFDITKAF